MDEIVLQAVIAIFSGGVGWAIATVDGLRSENRRKVGAARAVYADVVSKAIRLHLDYSKPFVAYHARYFGAGERDAPNVLKFLPYPALASSSLDVLLDVHRGNVVSAAVRFYEALHAEERDIRVLTEEAKSAGRAVQPAEMRVIAFRIGQALEQAIHCIEALRPCLDDREWQDIEASLARLHQFDLLDGTLLEAVQKASRIAKSIDAGEISQLTQALLDDLQSHRVALDTVLPH